MLKYKLQIRPGISNYRVGLLMEQLRPGSGGVTSNLEQEWQTGQQTGLYTFLCQLPFSVLVKINCSDACPGTKEKAMNGSPTCLGEDISLGELGKFIFCLLNFFLHIVFSENIFLVTK